MVRIAIEANLGAGKSTVLRKLRERHPNILVYEEPLNAWEDLLELFYANRSRWAMALQMRVLLDRLDPKYKSSCVMERCIYSCRYVFAQTLFSDGSLSEKEWKLFKEYYDTFKDEVDPNIIIYLRADPSVCLERVRQRHRNGEEHISIDYLQKLHFQYENMFKYYPGRVVVVDAAQDPEKVYKDVENIVVKLYDGASMCPDDQGRVAM
jgi:deoxyadenosine/deoxycytidine kinase